MKKTSATSLLLFGAFGLFAGASVSAGLVPKTIAPAMPVKEVSHSQEPALYQAVCARYDENVIDLTPVENDENMLYPYILDYSARGQWASKMKFLINEGTYSFYFIVGDPSYCSSSSLPTTYNQVTVEASALTSGGTKIAKNLDKSTRVSVYTFLRSDHKDYEYPIEMHTVSSSTGTYELRITFPHVDAAGTEVTKYEVDRFAFIADQTGSFCSINQINLRKYQSGRPFTGMHDYSHDVCGLTDDWSDSLPSGSTVRIDCEYGNKNLLEAKQLLPAVKAIDEYDGKNCEVKILEDNYTANDYILEKDWSVKLGASDERNNASTLNFIIRLHDTIKPNLSFASESDKNGLVYNYRDEVSEADVLKHFSYSDNYDSRKKCTAKVTGYDFATVRTTLAEVPVSVVVTDASGNTSQIDTLLKFVDRIGPSLSGPTEFSVPADEVLSGEQILSEYQASDEIDGSEVNLTIENDTYHETPEKIGSYTLDVVATDKSGNRTVQSAKVTVTDTKGPLFYLNNDLLKQFGTSAIVTPQQALSALVSQKILPDKIYSDARYIGGTYPYAEKEVAPGKYTAVLRAYGEDGSIETVSFTIEVCDNGRRIDGNNWFTNFWNDFVEMIRSIVAFFAKNY